KRSARSTLSPKAPGLPPPSPPPPARGLEPLPPEHTQSKSTWAAAALTAPGDLATPPSRDHADRLAALDDATWGRLRLAPGWTQADQGPEEVHTP
ncbi:hypothetical protein PV406_42140, partial [Streptomyces scabiei]|nr:hypothetical protein [Streptomyces scabiei]